MATKLKYKVDETSSSNTSSAKTINELKTSVASTKKAYDTAIIKLRYLAKKWRSSEDARVQGGCTPEEETFLNVNEEDGGTKETKRDNSVEKTS